MRQISFDEATAVSGGACEDLTLSVGLTNVSITGSLSDWGNCLDNFTGWLSDTYYSAGAYLSTGIPYGEAHVG